MRQIQCPEVAHRLQFCNGQTCALPGAHLSYRRFDLACHVEDRNSGCVGTSLFRSVPSELHPGRSERCHIAKRPVFLEVRLTAGPLLRPVELPARSDSTFAIRSCTPHGRQERLNLLCPSVATCSFDGSRETRELKQAAELRLVRVIRSINLREFQNHHDPPTNHGARLHHDTCGSPSKQPRYRGASPTPPPRLWRLVQLHATASIGPISHSIARCQRLDLGIQHAGRDALDRLRQYTCLMAPRKFQFPRPSGDDSRRSRELLAPDTDRA